MDFVVVCASHSDEILNANLARSPLLASVPLHIERGATSAAQAYNRALDATTAPVVVFAHHDVYLPQGWDALLAARLAEVAALDVDRPIVVVTNDQAEIADIRSAGANALSSNTFLDIARR